MQALRLLIGWMGRYLVRSVIYPKNNELHQLCTFTTSPPEKLQEGGEFD